MVNKFDEMRAAINEAQDTLRAADSVSTSMALVLRGRLRKVEYDWVLAELKKELKEFNAHTGEWKN